MIGQTISHYRITGELGRGGMGVVYKAEDTKLKRTVALKFLSPHLLADPKEKARFLHEAQAAAALDHPNISTIHEVHEADGHTFMVMAFIEGKDVGTKMDSGAMELDEALDIAVQVARGLSKAHASGIVHRDIKPGNVIVTKEGVAKIVDFGLAKLATQTKLTRTGTTVGTVRYMSPEQATGEAVDHRTDIWSLGVMLYEMLAGRPPFRGDVEPAMVYSILNEDPKPVTETRKDIPVALEDIIEKALAKDPAKRFATMDEFLAALEAQRDQITLGIKERKFTAIRKLRRRKRLSATIGAVLVVGIAAILTQVFYTRSMAIDSIAVLPFANLSGDPDQEYYSDGMTEALINELQQVSALKVISRTSVMQFKHTDKPLPEIAKELHVDAVVEASVTKKGDHVRITAQLIRARPERQIWADSYTRDASDVLSLQGEVARAITDHIQVAVTSEERDRLARERKVDPAAHDAFLRGQHLYWNGSEDATRRSMAYFRQAIDIDPTYAPAYAWLSFTYSRSAHFGFMSPEEAEPKAQAAASKALELDPSLADAHLAAGDYERALELNPNSVPALLKRMGVLARSGRFDESIEDAKRAIEIDPLTPYISVQLGWAYHFAGRYDKAIAALKKTVEMDPTFYGPWEQLAWCYAGKGMYAEAISAADTNLALIPNPMTDEITLGGMGRVYATSGRPDKARELLRTLLDLRTKEHVDAYYVAELYSGLGETDSVFIWLNRAYDEHSPSMKALRFEPWLLPLHDDPRYQDLERRYFGSAD